jgi:hypothetical protein
VFDDPTVEGHGRENDLRATVAVRLLDGGRARLTFEAIGLQGGRRRELVTLSDHGRRELIALLGGVPEGP